mgnify:CR=1 FL=1
MKWRELPKEARVYIVYSSLGCVVLFTWILLPYYMLLTGYSVLEVGLLYTVVEALGIPLTLAAGKLFSRLDIRRGLAAIDGLGALSLLLYAVSYGPMAPLILTVGMLIEKVSRSLYPLYQAYERAVYPQDRLKEVMAWHLRLPELAMVVSYPVAGFVLGYICPTDSCARAAFLFFACYSATIMLLALLLLEPVVLSEEQGGPGFLEALRSMSGKLRVYVAAYVLYILGWSLAPSFALVNYVIETYGGNIFHAAVVSASISAATVTATYILDLIPERQGFQAMQVGILIVMLGLLAVTTSPPFALLILTFYAIRIGDAIWFAFNRAWYLSLVSKEEVAIVLASISALVSLVSIVSPAIAGLLSHIDPRLPYAASLLAIASAVPLYWLAGRARKTQVHDRSSHCGDESGPSEE